MAIQTNNKLEDVLNKNKDSKFLQLGGKDNTDKKVKFQFLKDPIIGYEIFTEKLRDDGTMGATPVRSRDEKDLKNVTPFTYENGKPAKIKQMLVAPIFDFETNEVKILKIDKASVITSIVSIELDEDMGEVNDYVWKVSWDGEGLKRTYTTVTLGTKKEMTEDVLKQVSKIDMEAYLNSEKLEKIFGEDNKSEEKSEEVEDEDFDDF